MKDKNIKYNLDEELKRENITVSEELIQRTLHAIESGEPSNLQKYQIKKQKENSNKEVYEQENQIKESQVERNSSKEIQKKRKIQKKNQVKEENQAKKESQVKEENQVKEERNTQEKIKFRNENKIKEEINFKEKKEDKEKTSFQENDNIQEEFRVKVKSNWKRLRKVSIMVAGVSIILVGTYVIRIVEEGSKANKINTIYTADTSMDAIPQQANENVEEYSMGNAIPEEKELLGGTLKSSEDDTNTSGSEEEYGSKKIEFNIEENERSDYSTESAMEENNTNEQEEDKSEKPSESMLNSIEGSKEKDTTQPESESKIIEHSQKLNESLWIELGLTIQDIKAIKVVDKENEIINKKDEEIENQENQLENIEKIYQELNQYQLKEKIEIEEMEYEKQQEMEQEIYVYTTQDETEGIKIKIRKNYLIIEMIAKEEQKSRNVFLYERKE